ncbi:MAG: DUF4132 domain-containing protein [Planctomycetota bacterium]
MFRKKWVRVKPFEPKANDPLKREHKAVLKWVKDSLQSKKRHRWYEKTEMKDLPSGRVILAANPEEARRFVMAAVGQVRYWDAEAERVRSQGRTESERINAHLLPGWDKVWGNRQEACMVISTLMRRALPFEKDDLLRILSWCCETDNLSRYHAPLGHISRALERYQKQNEISPDLREAVHKFGVKLRTSWNKEAKQLGTKVEQVCAKAASREEEQKAGDSQEFRAVVPKAAGHPAVLNQLKCFLGLQEEDNIATEEIGPDRFGLRVDSPLKVEHELLSDVLNEAVGTLHYTAPILKSLKSGRRISKLDEQSRGRVLLAASERAANAILGSSCSPDEPRHWQSRYAALGTFQNLAREPFVLEGEAAFDLLLFFSTRPSYDRNEDSYKDLLNWLEERVQIGPLNEGERYVLYLLRASLIEGPPLGSPTEELRRLSSMIGDGAEFFLVPGEVWSDAVNAYVGKLSTEEKQHWSGLLAHLLTAKSAGPSAKWRESGKKFAEGIGPERVKSCLLDFLSLVQKGRSFRRLGSHLYDTQSRGDTIHQENATCLRGMLWIASLLEPDPDMARVVALTALSAYRKIPGVGPRAVKVGNAAVYALSEMRISDAVGQLAILQAKVKFGTAQKMIEKALNAAAEREGLGRDEIDELAVPAYGLTEVGKRVEILGDYQAEFAIADTRSSELRWVKADGKRQKTVPKAVKENFSEELKELKASAKDIQKMLGAQRDRIDQFHLKQKTWSHAIWRQRYLDHPLVGVLARRLIWEVELQGGKSALMWLDGGMVDVGGNRIEGIKDSAAVSLWHPIGKSSEEVLSWRSFLEDRQIKQPFKQAHREIYLLTDAEQTTGVYSNRFGGHIIKQHQFNALCGVRGWKNSLQLLVDQDFPPAHLNVPAYGIRTEFWVNGAGEDYGVDTNETGTFYYMATDQVRFYSIDEPLGAGGAFYGQNYGHEGAEPLALQDVPALVFSEVMRDVDLFVGVCSVGNDPNWADGGPDGRYRDYWHSYSFGDLSESAKTRKGVLENLIPRLKISERCGFEEKYLVVRGDIRTYKIHLGSGNILMEPNDQYLCIVPGRSAANVAGGRVFLPFEGDNTLSIILSKALLLAEDKKIKDVTILSQIKK